MVVNMPIEQDYVLIIIVVFIGPNVYIYPPIWRANKDKTITYKMKIYI